MPNTPTRFGMTDAELFQAAADAHTAQRDAHTPTRSPRATLATDSAQPPMPSSISVSELSTGDWRLLLARLQALNPSITPAFFAPTQWVDQRNSVTSHRIELAANVGGSRLARLSARSTEYLKDEIRIRSRILRYFYNKAREQNVGPSESYPEQVALMRQLLKVGEFQGQSVGIAKLCAILTNQPEAVFIKAIHRDYRPGSASSSGLIPSAFLKPKRSTSFDWCGMEEYPILFTSGDGTALRITRTDTVALRLNPDIRLPDNPTIPVDIYSMPKFNIQRSPIGAPAADLVDAYEPLTDEEIEPALETLLPHVGSGGPFFMGGNGRDSLANTYSSTIELPCAALQYPEACGEAPPSGSNDSVPEPYSVPAFINPFNPTDVVEWGDRPGN